jgi:hypothetical protein
MVDLEATIISGHMQAQHHPYEVIPILWQFKWKFKLENEAFTNLLHPNAWYINCDKGIMTSPHKDWCYFLIEDSMSM